MSDPLGGAFPNLFVDTLVESYQTLPDVTSVLRRPLRIIDPSGSMGIVPTDWVPLELETGTPDPTLQRYQVSLQLLFKVANEEDGRRLLTAVSKFVRVMLYQDRTLALRLRQMSEPSVLGIVERYQRHGVSRQRFATNELRGQFVHFSTTEVWLETESVGG